MHRAIEYRRFTCWDTLPWFLHIFNLNERTMGHVAHKRNQFQSINTYAQSYDYTIKLIKRKKTLPPLCFYIKFGWNWASDSGEESIFLNFVKVFLLLDYHLPVENDQDECEWTALVIPGSISFCSQWTGHS